MRAMRSVAGVDKELFRKTCARFATGIAVATVSGRDGLPYGLTINSFTSVSCSPPLVLICIDYRCNLLQHFRSSSWYGINILSESQQDLSVQFSANQAERFRDVQWYTGETGVPLLRNCSATMECGVSQVVEAGDHAILIAEVAAAGWQESEPLLYFASSYRKLDQI